MIFFLFVSANLYLIQFRAVTYFFLWYGQNIELKRWCLGSNGQIPWFLFYCNMYSLQSTPSWQSHVFLLDGASYPYLAWTLSVVVGFKIWCFLARALFYVCCLPRIRAIKFFSLALLWLSSPFQLWLPFIAILASTPFHRLFSTANWSFLSVCWFCAENVIDFRDRKWKTSKPGSLCGLGGWGWVWVVDEGFGWLRVGLGGWRWVWVVESGFGWLRVGLGVWG